MFLGEVVTLRAFRVDRSLEEASADKYYALGASAEVQWERWGGAQAGCPAVLIHTDSARGRGREDSQNIVASDGCRTLTEDRDDEACRTAEGEEKCRATVDGEAGKRSREFRAVSALLLMA